MTRPLYTAALAGAGLGAALLAASRHSEVVVPDYSTYYPVTVGTYRTYAVEDSTWTNGVVTVSRSQLRERVTAQFQDAAGQTAYRVVRSRRATATAAWVDDSVLTIQPLPRLVLQTRGNLRTVELVYPAEAGKTWNQYAFTVNSQAITYLSPDTAITSQTRRYTTLAGGPYTAGAAVGYAVKTYDDAVGTADILPTQVNDSILRRSGRQQVFARGIGPVVRRTYYYERFVTISAGAQNPTGRTENGNSHRETLIETGLI